MNHTSLDHIWILSISGTHKIKISIAGIRKNGSKHSLLSAPLRRNAGPLASRRSVLKRPRTTTDVPGYLSSEGQVDLDQFQRFYIRNSRCRPSPLCEGPLQVNSLFQDVLKCSFCINIRFSWIKSDCAIDFIVIVMFNRVDVSFKYLYDSIFCSRNSQLYVYLDNVRVFRIPF